MELDIFGIFLGIFDCNTYFSYVGLEGILEGFRKDVMRIRLILRFKIWTFGWEDKRLAVIADYFEAVDTF
jgi:hypothetical protein